MGSFSIVLDKPFVVGDFIVVGSLNGVVENIGIKTTRVRALSGEQIVFSNKDLLSSRVQNFKSMWQRRVVQKFSVAYATPPEKLRPIPGWIRAFVEREPKLKFDRCHLAYYGASTLDFELVFMVTDPDYNVYMDLQQELFLRNPGKICGRGHQHRPAQPVGLRGENVGVGRSARAGGSRNPASAGRHRQPRRPGELRSRPKRWAGRRARGSDRSGS